MALQLYREMPSNGPRCEDAVSIAFRSSGVSSIGKARSLAETRVRLRLPLAPDTMPAISTFGVTQINKE